ncbi:hypothetical protein K474DRAFT_1155190 [Panus rudis PR-1116 ss-1]|nr:hypothetical protein K474DRAFT_1155190 [Panus rudis PR-1116 ss-1]
MCEAWVRLAEFGGLFSVTRSCESDCACLARVNTSGYSLTHVLSRPRPSLHDHLPPRPQYIVANAMIASRKEVIADSEDEGDMAGTSNLNTVSTIETPDFTSLPKGPSNNPDTTNMNISAFTSDVGNQALSQPPIAILNSASEIATASSIPDPRTMNSGRIPPQNGNLSMISSIQSASSSNVPPKPKPRPKPRIRRAGPDAQAVPSSISNGTPALPQPPTAVNDSIQPASSSRVLDIPNGDEGFDAFSLGIAESAKLRSRARTSKGKQKAPIVSEHDVIELLTSEDELALPPPPTKKAQTKKKASPKRKKTTHKAVEPVVESTPILPIPNPLEDGDTSISQGLPPSDPPFHSSAATHPPQSSLPEKDPNTNLSPPSSPLLVPSRKRKRNIPAALLDEEDHLHVPPAADIMKDKTVGHSTSYDQMPPPPPPQFFASSSSYVSGPPVPDASSSSAAATSSTTSSKKRKRPGKVDDEDDFELELEMSPPKSKPKTKGRKKKVNDSEEEWDAHPQSAKTKTKAKAKAKAKTAATSETTTTTSTTTTKGRAKTQKLVVELPETSPSKRAGSKSAKTSPEKPAQAQKGPVVDSSELSSLSDLEGGEPPDKVVNPSKAPAKGRNGGTAPKDAPGPSAKAKGKRKAVLDWDEEDEQRSHAPPPTPAPTGRGKGKKAAAAVQSSPNPPQDSDLHKENEVPSSQESSQPLPELPPPKPPAPPQLSTPRPAPSNRSRSIIPKNSNTPMSELIRKVNSLPGSPFAASASSSTTPRATAYSPYAKASRTLLRKIAPLHPNRRTPPPPPPRPPPPKKTKKQIEMEERWEMELEESVEGWYVMTEEERAALRRAKRDAELGFED